MGIADLFHNSIRAYDREYSNFYDYAQFGSGVSLERLLPKNPTWRGYLALAMGYDLGLTGLPVDYEKAAGYYRRAGELIDRRNRNDTQPYGEFSAFYGMSPDNTLHEETIRTKTVRRVALGLVATCWDFGNGDLSGVAREERLVKLLSSVPYRAEGKSSPSKEERQTEVIIQAATRLLSMYYDFKFPVFDELVQCAMTESADDFTALIMGMMFWDVRRNPYGSESLRETYGKDYRDMGIQFILNAAERGSVAALQYLRRIEKESSIGKAYVASGLAAHPKKDGISTALEALPQVAAVPDAWYTNGVV